jgi:hypothetical protein
MVQDNVALRAHKHQRRVYNFFQIIKMIWPSNSPDLTLLCLPDFGRKGRLRSIELLQV